MTHRRCATCKHFEQAPIFRKGWCRNPLLYSPQQSHLVSEDDLDCERGMGNYWEPSDDWAMAQSRAFPSAGRLEVTERDTEEVASASAPLQMRSSRGVPIYPVSGSSGYGSEPPPPGGPEPGGWGSGDDRNSFGYYEDERYWTDYLRIVAPLLGVILLVVLLWFWIVNALGDDDDDNGDIAADATGTEMTFPTLQETATEDTGGSGTAAAPGTVELPTATVPGDSGTAPAGVTEPVGNGGTALYNGATAEVANTGGVGVNVRSEPTTASEILNVYLDGTQVQIIGDAVDAEGLRWWPVTGEGVEQGWIAQDYLVLVE